MITDAYVEFFYLDCMFNEPDAEIATCGPLG